MYRVSNIIYFAMVGALITYCACADLVNGRHTVGSDLIRLAVFGTTHP